MYSYLDHPVARSNGYLLRLCELTQIQPYSSAVLNAIRTLQSIKEAIQ